MRCGDRIGVGHAVGLLLLCAACTAQAPPASVAPAPPVSVAPQPVDPADPVSHRAQAIPFTLPVLAPGPAATQTCLSAPAGASSPAPGARLVMYDYEPVILLPVAYGPRASERLHEGSPRTLGEARDAMHRSAAYFAGCYRWARDAPRRFGRRGTFEPIMRVILDVDVFGHVVRATVSQDGGEPGLAACVRSGLLTLQLSRRTGRSTRIDGTIEFRASGQPRSRTRSMRPRIPAREPLGRATCVHHRPSLPIDRLQGVIGAFDDFDRASAARSQIGSRLPLRVACASVLDGLDKRWMAPYLRSNDGALRQCYRDALGRSPGLSGALVATFEAARGGNLHSIAVTGVGDAALHACVNRALSAIVLPSTSRRIRFRMPFALTPAPADETLPAVARARADALLRRGDGAAAAAVYANVIRASDGGPDECHGRLGVVRAMMSVAPWLRDTRVDGAVSQLLAYLAGTASARATASCRTEAASVVANLAAWPLHPGPHGDYPLRHNAGLGAVATRVRALLGAWPGHPQRIQLTDLLARAETAAGEDARARSTWVELLGMGPLDAALVQRAIRGYNEVQQRLDRLPTMRDQSCPAVRRLQ